MLIELSEKAFLRVALKKKNVWSKEPQTSEEASHSDIGGNLVLTDWQGKGG